MRTQTHTGSSEMQCTHSAGSKQRPAQWHASRPIRRQHTHQRKGSASSPSMNEHAPAGTRASPRRLRSARGHRGCTRWNPRRPCRAGTACSSAGRRKDETRRAREQGGCCGARQPHECAPPSTPAERSRITRIGQRTAKQGVASNKTSGPTKARQSTQHTGGMRNQRSGEGNR